MKRIFTYMIVLAGLLAAGGCGKWLDVKPYDKIAEEFGDRLEVVKINIDDEPVLAHNEHIEVIPTLVIYSGGKAISSVVAPESKAAISAFIDESLGK